MDREIPYYNETQLVGEASRESLEHLHNQIELILLSLQLRGNAR